jgi:hypothetical protein
MNQSERREPYRGRHLPLRDIVEGTMDMPTSETPRATQTDDQQLRAAQQALVATFATRFDTWAERVTAVPPIPQRPMGISLPDLMAVTPAVHELDRVSALVWDLARLCRDFIILDLSAWGAYLRRSGLGSRDIARSLQLRAPEALLETKDHRWSAGLGVLRRHRFPSMFDEDGEGPHEADAWRVVVDDAIPDLIDSVVMAAILEPKTQAVCPEVPRSLANRDRVDDFIRLVSLEMNGATVTKMEVARLAGYNSKRELQSFQRNEPLGDTPRANIERALNLAPTEAARMLKELRNTRGH